MKIFLVGGAVRDRLLGSPSKDNDYVVVGSSHEEMIEKNFRPVGKSHLVYLHPETKAQYTLATSLEEDLKRRDLTINAMALFEGVLIDPFGGKKDLQDKILKHVLEENYFVDPLRVYRVARFAAQFPEFRIHPETLVVLKKAGQTSEFRNLSSQRIFNELMLALGCPRPCVFFHTLEQINLLNIHFPELKKLAPPMRDHSMSLLNQVSRLRGDNLELYAALFIHLDKKSALSLSDRLSAPKDFKKMSLLTALYYQKLLRVYSLKEEEVVELFYALDAFRRDKFLHHLGALMRYDHHEKTFSFFMKQFKQSKSISSQDVREISSGASISKKLKEKRIEILKSTLASRINIPKKFS